MNPMRAYEAPSASVKKRVRFEGNGYCAHIMKKLKFYELSSDATDETTSDSDESGMVYDEKRPTTANNEIEIDSSEEEEEEERESGSEDTSGEDLDEASESIESAYEGTRNSAGEPHGQGVERILVGAKCVQRYEGGFKDGLRSGRGKIIFPDSSFLECATFVDGLATGPTAMHLTDGTRITGDSVDGVIEGPAKEIGADGRLLYEGQYHEGVRDGPGRMHFYPEGGWLQGEWVNGAVEGKATYYFPDGSYLTGTWADGSLVRGKFTSCFADEPVNPTIYCADVSTKKRIARFPLRQDPYELQYCYVKGSTIPGSGEGLFAKRDVKKGTIISMYNGIRIDLLKAEARGWDYKANLICLNDFSGMCVDVPPEYSQLSQFRNTVGHKCNHSWDNNCLYDAFYGHPILGRIKCIRTTKDVKKGEEFLVDYGYERHDCPAWYAAFMEGHWPAVPTYSHENPTNASSTTTSS